MNKLKQIQLKSVSMKLFVTVFCSIVILSSILGLTSYQISKRIIMDQVGATSSQAIEQAADKIDFLFAEYESLSRQLSVDQTLKTDLELINKAGISTFDSTQAADQIKSKLNSIAGSDERLFGVRLVPLSLIDADAYRTTGLVSIRSDEKIGQKIDEIVEAKGKPVWFPSLKKGFFEVYTEPTITMARLLRNLQHPEAEYILLVEIKSQAIGDILSNLQIGEAGEIRIVTADHQIVHAKDPSVLESLSFIQVSNDVLEKNSKSFEMNDEQGMKQMVVFQPLSTTNWTIMGFAPVNDFVKATNQLLYITFVVVIVAICIALLIGYYVVFMVGRPLNKLCNLMEEGEQGNLQVRTNFRSNDEIGRLGQSFNRMMEQISSLVEQTNISAREVLMTAEELAKASKGTSLSAAEISAAMQDISAGSTDLAMEAEHGNRLVDSMGQKMDLVTVSNQSMDAAAERVIRVSAQGSRYMEELVEQTAITSRMTVLLEENSGKLTTSTQQVQNILKPMIEMTKQTNILSINASIEASRAGIAGKGFMVIADEIRGLATQSADSIQFVSNITEQIQDNIRNTVKVLNDVAPLFDLQKASVLEASMFFQSVRNEMNALLTSVRESSDLVKELLRSQQTLGSTIANVSAVGEQASASTEEVASMTTDQFKVSEQLVVLSNQLARLAEALKQSLVAFHI